MLTFSIPTSLPAASSSNDMRNTTHKISFHQTTNSTAPPVCSQLLKVLLHHPSSITCSNEQDKDNNDSSNEMHHTGLVLWPSAVMLAWYISRYPSIIFGKSTDSTTINSDGDCTAWIQGDVLELGAGVGLVGLTAAMLLDTIRYNEKKETQGDNCAGLTNVEKVIFTDYNPIVLENLDRNIRLNCFHNENHKVVGMDWFDQQLEPEQKNHELDDSNSHLHHDGYIGTNNCTVVNAKKDKWVDMSGKSHAQVRLILAADILVCSNDADLVAATIDAVLVEGGHAIILRPDENSRFGVAHFPQACRAIGLVVNVTEDILLEEKSDFCEGLHRSHLLQDLKDAGFVNSYDFTMFTISKPILAS